MAAGSRPLSLCLKHLKDIAKNARHVTKRSFCFRKGCCQSVRLDNFFARPPCLCGQTYIRKYLSTRNDSQKLQNQNDQKYGGDPYLTVKQELDDMYSMIRQKLESGVNDLTDICQYYFDGKGKSFRPMLILNMALALNIHSSNHSGILHSQREVAYIAEMIHTASLIHDDVIDVSDTRRGKPSVDTKCGQRKAILAGDYILSVSSAAIARLGNQEVVKILSLIIEDLVRGEFMQLGAKEDENERFNHYLKKTYKKTASLVANSCKSVAVLAKCSEKDVDLAYDYGRNLGIAFQLIDDLLDFTSCDQLMGKPTAADLKLGLATAPVLFAAQEHSELPPLIMRRFSQEGDVERARELVASSDGVKQTRILAEQHCEEAKICVELLQHSPARDALVHLTEIVLNRKT